jgi:hypothetical protein
MGGDFMISKNINRLLSSILGVALTIGITEMPVLADNSVQATSVYSTNTNLTEDNYILNKDNSVQQNGLNIRINRIIGTKHKLKVTVLVKSEKPLDETNNRNIMAKLTYGKQNHGSESISYKNIDENTLRITFERDTHDDEEFAEKGELRVDLVMQKYKVNVGIDADVDFTESFKNTIEKDISEKIPDSDSTLKKIEVSNLGTEITCLDPKIDFSDRENSIASRQSTMILKVGDKMYKVRHSGSHTSGKSKNDNMSTSTYETEAVTYDMVKDQKDISVIPISCNMTLGEVENISKTFLNNKDDKGKNINKETINNVTYEKSFEFSNGNKGEIYNVERNDNSIKVYCRGTSEKEGLMMASNIYMNYHIEEGKFDRSSYYEGNDNVSFYKDSKNALGYVVEFNNVEKDKAINLNLNCIIKQIDRYKVGEEIKISK